MCVVVKNINMEMMQRPRKKKEKKGFTFQENVFPSSSYSFRLNKTKRKKIHPDTTDSTLGEEEEEEYPIFLFLFGHKTLIFIASFAGGRGRKIERG
jgi:hypothetical protein